MSLQARFQIDRPDFSLDVEFTAPAEGVTAIFGPSGSGKSTLLRAIAGLEEHKGGMMKVGDVCWQDAEHFVPPHKRNLGYVFQEASLFPHLSVKRNLEYGLKRVPQEQRKISLERAIELLGIHHLLNRKPDTLSGGERQRVALARALAVSPKLLLMDEPLAALDQSSKQEILPYLESLHDELNIPILYVSHTLEEIARLADHLVLLDGGRIVASGAINQMLTRLDLPLSRSADAAAIFDAVVTGFDEGFHLTHLKFDGGTFTVPGKALQPGHHVRLRLAARDVSLTLEHQESTSIQNIFPATVDEIMPESDSQVMVRLLIGGIPTLSRITQKSASELSLQPGASVYAQVKSVVLLH